MSLDITRFIFIDNHAHSVLRDHLELDALGFRRCFTESSSVDIIESHVQHSVHYMDLLDHLERIFDIRSENDFLNFRSKQQSSAFIRMLWDDVSIGALIIDDGYGGAGSMTLPELSDASGRPIYHCRRIEPLLEDCINKAGDFDGMQKAFQAKLSEQGKHKLVALKSILGYRGGLALDRPSLAQAKSDFDGLKRSGEPLVRIERRPLYHYMLAEAFELAGQNNLPIQIHSGIGDDDANLRDCNPSLMQDVFRARRFAGSKFVLLHCFPFVKEAAFMSSLYANVYMDLSLAVSLASPLAATMIADALSIAPSTKLLAGSDGHTCPEAHWYGALSWKRGMTRALFTMVNNGSITHREAEQIGGYILHGNAIALYGLEGLA